MSKDCGRVHPTDYCQCEACSFANEDRIHRLRALQSNIPLFDILDWILDLGCEIRLHKSGRDIHVTTIYNNREIVVSSTHPDSVFRQLASEIGIKV